MTPSVLVVDDEPAIRENLQAYLEDEGMWVAAVASAEQAIERVKQGEHYAVCIMDIRLSGMDGNAAIMILHELCPNMKFIVHTGTANYTLPRELRDIGIHIEQVYLKPLDDMQPMADTVRLLARFGR